MRSLLGIVIAIWFLIVLASAAQAGTRGEQQPAPVPAGKESATVQALT